MQVRCLSLFCDELPHKIAPGRDEKQGQADFARAETAWGHESTEPIAEALHLALVEYAFGYADGV